MRKRLTILSASILAVVLALTASCTPKKKGGGDGNQPDQSQPSNKWDQMKWDQGKWGFLDKTIREVVS